MAKKKTESPESNYHRAVRAWKRSVAAWLHARRGRQVELATVLQVKRYAINDWFISRRKEPPLWVLFAVNATLIERETQQVAWQTTSAEAFAARHTGKGGAK